MHTKFLKFLLSLLLLFTAACNSGGSGAGSSGSANGEGATSGGDAVGSLDRRGGSDAANFGCDGSCANQNLTVEDVTRILQQAVAGAQTLGIAATIAVLDRPSNVLAVYRMPGAQTTSLVTSGTAAQGGIEGATVPAEFCAISKAGTATNFSSQGNAFGTRSASQLLQENYLPGEDFAPSGPLFGVQFSQGLCSDINPINPDLVQGGSVQGSQFFARGLVGPRPLPIGFAGDPGSTPLYKQGDHVGAIAVELDGIYSVDRDLRDFDDSDEERVAMSGAMGFEPPSERVASVISVRGKSLRLTELDYSEIAPLPAELPVLDPANLLAIPFFTNGQIIRGSVYGNPESGIARGSRLGIDTEFVVDENGNRRFPSISGAPLPGGIEFTAAEVDALLDTNIFIANKTRAQVRRPLGSAARVAIWIVDTNGTVIGFTRSRDTILDSTDVTLQKARSPLFFSSADAEARLRAAGQGEFVDRAIALLGPNVFNGTYAWSSTALGNISRPWFPDGVLGNPPGPLSLPVPGTAGAASTWSVFNTGLQLQLYLTGFLPPLGSPPVAPASCTPIAGLRNGVTFFPGGFPLYRNGQLIGAIASSGDGTEQDDLIPFYGASRKGLDEAGFTNVGDPELGFNAPKEMRADQIPVNFDNVNLRYVVCPEAPFLGSDTQNVCGGL